MNHCSHRRRPHVVVRAFTLLEVLVVSGILVILLAISYPTLESVRNRATHTACAEHIHQLGEAEHLYANDHDGWVPPATTSAGNFTHFQASESAIGASPQVLRTALDPYVKSQAVWFCPADNYAHQHVLWLGMYHNLSSYWILPVTDGTLSRNWPPRMQLMGNTSDSAKGVPLICDAVGIPVIDSDPKLANGDHVAETSHPDHMVNVIRADLSLSRVSARTMMGSDE